MDSSHQINVPLRSGGKKMRKRRDLDALIAPSLAKRNGCRRPQRGSAAYSQDKLLSASTDDQDDYYWPNTSTSSIRRRNRKLLILHKCGPLLFIMITAFLIGLMYWLYIDMRQQIYDYRQKLEEVSATNQNLPETLQKWHETSTFLLRNQSSLHTKFNDMQRTLDTLRNNLSDYINLIDLKKHDDKDEKLVADFGAKIEAVATDVESIKDRYNSVVEAQKDLQKDLKNLTIRLNATDTVSVAGEIPSNHSEELKAFEKSLLAQLKELDVNVSIVNDTLSQRSTNLYEELVAHKNKLDDLLDRSENLTSHITSIENSWPEYKQKLIDNTKRVSYIESDITQLKIKTQKIDNILQNVCNSCKDSFLDVAKSLYKTSSTSQKSSTDDMSAMKGEMENATAGAGTTLTP